MLLLMLSFARLLAACGWSGGLLHAARFDGAPWAALRSVSDDNAREQYTVRLPVSYISQPLSASPLTQTSHRILPCRARTPRLSALSTHA